MTDSTSADPTESLTDPESYRAADGVDYYEAEDDSHFEMNRDTAGVAAVGVTNADGAVALVEFEPATMIPHARVEPGGDFAQAAHDAADDLLGVEIALDDLVRVRRNVSSPDDRDEEAIAYDVVFAATPATENLPDADDVQSCQAEATSWFDSIPDDLPDGGVRADAELFID